MYSVSTEYKEIMNRYLRNSACMIVSIGIINNEAQSDAYFSGTTADWSNKTYPLSGRYGANEYVTYEQNKFSLDGTKYLVPDNNVYLSNIGITSKDILGQLSVVFRKPYTLKGLTIDFGTCYPTSFQINGVTYSNNKSEFSTEDVFTDINQLNIKPLTMVGGQQRMTINGIKMGVGIVFEDSVIESAEIVENVSSICEEIPNNTFNINIYDEKNVYNVDDDNSFINFLETGQNVNVVVGLQLDDETYEYLEMGNFSLSDWKSSQGKMSFSATDIIQFMNDTYTSGNTIHSRTLYADAIAVLEDFGLEPDEYSLDECLKDVTITNPLPEVSQAECLQMIANAGRCVLYQNRSGQVVIKANFENVIDPDDYTVSTTDNASWSKPNNLMRGSDITYVDYTENLFSADGSMYLLPASGGTLATSYVSNSVSDSSGNFTTNPKVTITMPNSFIYYSLKMKFDGNPPQEFKISTYLNNTLVETVTVTDIDKVTTVNHEFKKFNKIVVEFTKGTPNNRIILNKFSFGDLSDYTLRKEDMLENPVGYREKKVKNVSVKRFTFTNDEEGLPVQKDDNVFYIKTLNDKGSQVTFENPLIKTEQHAHDVADWLSSYYMNNVAYDVKFRGEPRLNASDIITMESDVINNLQVEVEKVTLTYNGAFGGDLALRRAMKMM